MMKTILIFCLQLVGVLAHADRFSVYPLDQLKTYVTEHHSCFVGVAVEDVFHVNKWPEHEIGFSRDVLCIADIVTGIGGIQQKAGCGIALFDTENNVYSPTYDPRELRDPAIKDPFNRVINEPCSTAWRKLLPTRSGMFQGKNVEELLTKDQQLYVGQTLLSGSTEATIWFNETRAKVIAAKKYDAPMGYLNAKFGMTMVKVRQSGLCNLKSKPEKEMVFGKHREIYRCFGIPFEERKVEGLVDFDNGKLAQIVLGVGLPNGDSLVLIKSAIDNYLNILTRSYGVPVLRPTSKVLDDFLAGPTARSIYVNWLDKTVQLRLDKEPNGYGATLLLSSRGSNDAG